ncbi:MAG: hypothetical protein ACYCXX_07295 [Acidiferrobacter thiooxydans]
MDVKAEKKRLRHLESVKKYFAMHRGEIKHVGMTWPIVLLKRIDEAAAVAGVSRRAWLLALCERELTRLQKKYPISPEIDRSKDRGKSPNRGAVKAKRKE